MNLYMCHIQYLLLTFLWNIRAPVIHYSLCPIKNKLGPDVTYLSYMSHLIISWIFMGRREYYIGSCHALSNTLLPSSYNVATDYEFEHET